MNRPREFEILSYFQDFTNLPTFQTSPNFSIKQNLKIEETFFKFYILKKQKSKLEPASCKYKSY